MWFNKRAANNVDPSVCNPIIVNQTNESIVLFMERGVLYNKQILAPGEAVGMTRSQTSGAMVVPYKIHAVVGDEKNLPTRTQSVKNLISTAVIPTAFVIGALTAASSAGASTAVSRAAGSLVVRGMVIDSAALAAGSIAANRAAFIADKLIEKHPENFSAKSGLYLPGNRYVTVQGGIDQPLTISTITEAKFRQIPIKGEVKIPMDTLQDKIEYYTSSIRLRSSKTKENTRGLPDALTDENDSSSLEPQQEQQGQQQQIQDESEEDRQVRLAIEESLKIEEERKKEIELYNKQVEESVIMEKQRKERMENTIKLSSKQKSVVLF